MASTYRVASVTQVNDARPLVLHRLREKWETSIQTGHWPLARSQGKAQSGGNCYLTQLPTELLLKITSYLPVIPRASLALTCTQLFLADVVVLDLELLQNRRWLACSRCLKLHTVASFPQREREKQPEDRICNLGDLAGVVDLCPCIKFTFHGKMDLVDLLRARQQSLTALATQCGVSAQERFCWHSCVMNYGPSEIKIRILPELDEADMLKVRVEYRLTIEIGQLGKEESMIPRLGCAHRAVDMWLASVCNKYDESGYIPSHISTCSIWSGNAVYDFYTERCLGPGNVPLPDHQWAVQRSHAAGDRRTVGDCDEHCPWSPNKYHLLP
ncbi:hypothetical protein BDV41DRAFT_568625 [Aspergillus transmontanensis]|uniref:F-box domain-containing protein n=1 Tax=Aspergillus transmontanensis TaxID=1034304 RepID=A0A5N6VIF3_9EURO|nr:hypothetical protein BDV41DRAFT_568625 [Aspergillus transmontanensis]